MPNVKLLNPDDDVKISLALGHLSEEFALMDDTLTAIEERIQSLENELSALPEFQKLQELKAFKARHLEYIQERQRLLGGEEPSSVALDAPAPQPLNVTQEEGTASTITTPTDRIILTVRKILEAHGKPMPIAALHDELDKRKIVIGGLDPRANLSTKLSSAKGKVYNAKPLGWWLPERAEELSEMQESLANGVARLS